MNQSGGKIVIADKKVEKYHLVALVGYTSFRLKGDTVMKKILVDNIEDAMVLGREVCGTSGNVLLSKGTVLSAALGRRLQNWGISSVYIEGEEEMHPEENTVTVSSEALEVHLTAKFGNTLKNQNMKKIFNAVYHYRLHKIGK